MLVAGGILGSILLFFGRELNFLLAASMAAFIGLRLTPLLPPPWPAWSRFALIALFALTAAAATIRMPRPGYFLSGFLTGAAVLVEYYEPGVLTLPLLPFLVGGAIGSLVIGIFGEWALLIVSCLIGAYSLTRLFTLSPTAEILTGAGLFIVGALTQVVMKRMENPE